MNLFLEQLLNGNSPSFESILNILEENKNTIYAEDSVLKKEAGLLNGLFLQLLANMIIKLSIDEDQFKNIGSNKLLSNHHLVKLGQTDIGGGITGLAILQTSTWAGIKCI